MKKVIEGIFKEPYYNKCEAGCPLGIALRGKSYSPATKIRAECDVLCDLVKEAFDLPWNTEDVPNKLLGKKVKITIEVEE